MVFHDVHWLDVQTLRRKFNFWALSLEDWKSVCASFLLRRVIPRPYFGACWFPVPKSGPCRGAVTAGNCSRRPNLVNAGDILPVFPRKLKQPYNVRPPSDVSWLISPSNYSYLRTINHSYWSYKPYFNFWFLWRGACFRCFILKLWGTSGAPLRHQQKKVYLPGMP